MPESLIVFAKPPVPGQVKTRLTTLLAPDEAADLYAAFLADALAQYAALASTPRPHGASASGDGAAGDGAAGGGVPSRLRVRLYLATDADPLADALPGGLVPDGVTLHRQVGDGLGARMAHAVRATFAGKADGVAGAEVDGVAGGVAGGARAVVIGTDHPTLPSAHVRAAFARLDAPDAVTLGPSADGGYYLLGLRRAAADRACAAAFAGMTFSHEAVYAQTRARLDAAGLRPVALPAWYDVDTPAALVRLVRALACHAAPAAPRTRAALRRLDVRARLMAAGLP